jgi:tellurite resistance protein
MSELFPEIEIRDDEAGAMAYGFITIARADGQLHEREAALIADFYGSTTNHSVNMAELERAPPVDGVFLAAKLASSPLREVFLKTAILLAYADGNFSAAESKLITQFGAALGVDEKTLDHYETQVKEFMLSQLTHVQNTAAVAEVAKELKI